MRPGAMHTTMGTVTTTRMGTRLPITMIMGTTTTVMTTVTGKAMAITIMDMTTATGMTTVTTGTTMATTTSTDPALAAG